ncbi:MAG TPA: DM13 domain-containing protein [Solirubrobacterales bacterium]|nr:DM13 domain-containing protein [Solirubrobacterales bacterium]
MSRERLVSALLVASSLGAGLLVLQRWVAETKAAAIILVAIWFALVGIAALVVIARRPELRLPVLGTFASILAATVAIGYVTGFRDMKVNEDVVMASERVPDTKRDSALAGNSAQDESGMPEKPAGPVELAMGDFTGADGHAGSGVVTVVRDTDGSRSLTFTDFDVDPGAKVVVWLTRDDQSLEDRIDLGGLKGNVGNQAYELPEDADLRRYDTVVLYCTPFTVRIAVAPLT